MKLTKEQINKIKELRKEGKTYAELSKIFKVSFSTIYYHLNKQKILNNLKKYKEKRATYYKERYNADDNFRKKEINRVKKARIIRLAQNENNATNLNSTTTIKKQTK